MINDDARRLLDGVRELLGGFTPDASVARLDQFVSRLSGALGELDGRVDPEWFEELRSAWWPLEHVNAIALADERLALSPAEIGAVSEARDEFLALLTEY